jgi:hypothetical protein
MEEEMTSALQAHSKRVVVPNTTGTPASLCKRPIEYYIDRGVPSLKTGTGAVFFFNFKPKTGLRKQDRRMTNSYVARHPEIVNSKTRTNCNGSGICNGKMINEPV